MVIVVLGTHRSGSSCTAGILANLGIYMGEKFAGCEPDGGYEAVTLARLCEQYMPFPTIKPRTFPQNGMKRFIQGLKSRSSVSAMKYPHLCMIAGQLE